MSDGRDVDFITLSEARGRRSVTWRGADVQLKRSSTYPRFKVGAVYAKA